MCSRQIWRIWGSICLMEYLKVFLTIPTIGNCECQSYKDWSCVKSLSMTSAFFEGQSKTTVANILSRRWTNSRLSIFLLNHLLWVNAPSSVTHSVNPILLVMRRVTTKTKTCHLATNHESSFQRRVQSLFQKNEVMNTDCDANVSSPKKVSSVQTSKCVIQPA